MSFYEKVTEGCMCWDHLRERGFTPPQDARDKHRRLYAHGETPSVVKGQEAGTFGLEDSESKAA